MLTSYQMLKSDNFEIYHCNEHVIAQNASNALEQALDICQGFFAFGTTCLIRVVLVTERDEFDRLVKGLLNVEIEVPSHPARIAQTQRHDMVVLSPSAFQEHSIYSYEPNFYNRLLFHELIHIIEESLSPNIEAVPNWWSEGLAIYLSEQWRFDNIFRNPAYEGVMQRKIPSLDQISKDRGLSYDWGWTIVYYIKKQYGKKMINNIVRNCTDGNILKHLGLDIQRWEQDWKLWLEKNIVL